MISTLTSAIPLSVAVLLLAVGTLQVLAGIKLIPHPMFTDRVAWVVLGIGLITTAGTLGWLSDFQPADQTEVGEYEYSISPGAIADVSYSSDTGDFTTNQVYDATADELQSPTPTMEFSVSRADELAEASVFTVEVLNNPELEDDNGETHKLFQETADDKVEVRIEDNDGFAYESRTFGLDPVDGAGTVTFDVEASLNKDFVSEAMNEFPEEPYESGDAVISVAGQEYDYNQILEEVVE